MSYSKSLQSNKYNRIINISLGILFYEKLKNLNPKQNLLINGIDNSEIQCEHFIKATENIAKHLQKIGVVKNDVVTIIAYNCWEYLSIILACWYIGATVNPLNENYTSGEMNHFFKISTPKAIFCSLKALENVQKSKPSNSEIILIDSKKQNDTPSLDNIIKTLHNNQTFLSPVELNPDEDLALILTSSGTTGLPKCVMITHSNLATPLESFGYANYLICTKNLITILNLPFFHVYGIFISLMALFCESKSIILNKFSPNTYLTIIEKYKINTLFTVPPILLFLLKHSEVNKCNLSSLETVYFGGASFSAQQEEALHQRFPKVQFLQLWGMTETTFSVTAMPKNSKCTGSIGKPCPNYKVIVCDNNGVELGPNEYGELRVKGTGVTKGYFKNEDATNQAFDKNGYLKSGDLGYYNEEGYFFIVGRLKEIIKYKAFQVPPAEIEALLLKHDGVQDAAVVGMPDEKCGEKAVAFIVKSANYDINEDMIIEYVKNNISVEKQLHGGVRFVDEIPKTPSGKILRRKLL